MAAADHLAIVRVLCDESSLFLRALVPEPDDTLPGGVKILFLGHIHGEGQDPCHHPPDGQGGSEAGGLDADEVHQPGAGHLFPDDEIPEAALAGGSLFGSDTGIGADDLSALEAGEELLGLGPELVHDRLGGRGVSRVLDVLGAGTDDEVAVDGGGQVHPQTADARLGGRIDGHGEDVSLIQNEIFSPAGVDGIAVQTRQGGHLCTVETGAVHHPSGGKDPVPGGDTKPLGSLLNGDDLGVQEELYTVF